MAELRYRHFNPLEKFPADWPTAVGAFIAPMSNLNLAAKSAGVVMAPVSSQTQLSIGVDGLWRYTEVEVDAAVPSGIAQTFDIVATTTANAFKSPVKEGEGEGDETNYSFALQVVTHGTLPSGGGIAAAQKVGEVDWNGAAISGIRQQVGTLRSTDPLSPTMPLTTVSALTVNGIAAPTVPLAAFQANAVGDIAIQTYAAGVSKLKVTAGGKLEWSGGAILEGVAGNELIVHGKLVVSEAATLTGGGTSTTPAEGDNTTKIATTAFIHTAVGGLAPLASPHLTGTTTAVNLSVSGTTKLEGALEQTGTTLGLLGTAPVAQSKGWGAPAPPGGTFKTVLTYASTVDNVIDSLETLKAALKAYGILGA